LSDWCAADHNFVLKEQSALLIAQTLPGRAFTPAAAQRGALKISRCLCAHTHQLRLCYSP
jgi:hypothetical protein